MTEDQFRALCNTYGFAPSRALREMLDAAMKEEREACAKAVERHCGAWDDKGFALVVAIRTKEKT